MSFNSINDLETALQRANHVMHSGDAQQAIKLFTIVIEHGDIDLQARAYGDRGVAYELSGDFDSAMNDYNSSIEYAKIVKFGRVFLIGHVKRGAVLRRFGRIAEALDDFNLVIEKKHILIDDPEGITSLPVAYFYRAMILANMGRTAEALNDFNAAQNLTPHDIDIYLDRATMIWLPLCDFQRVQADLEIAEKIQPDHYQIYYLQYHLFLSRGDLQGAVQAVERFMAVGGGQYMGNQVQLENWLLAAKTGKIPGTPSEAEILKSRELTAQALALVPMAKIDEVETICNQALELDPHNEEALLLLADTFMHVGDNSAAVMRLNEAIWSSHHFSWQTIANHIKRADLYAYFGLFEASLEDIITVVHYVPEIKSDFENFIPLLHRGLKYIEGSSIQNEDSEYDELFQDFIKHIALDLHDAGAQTVLGIALVLNEEYDRAIACFDQAIVLNPKDIAIRVNRASAYNLKGNNERAIAEYNLAIQLNPTYAGAYSGRGIVYFEMDNYDRALADLNQAINLAPNSAGVLRNRASVYRKLGKIAEAEADEREADRIEAG